MKHKPLKSPLRYPGGKSRVAKYLREFAPAKYNDYREIFAGGAAMFFQLPRARKSWINDLHPGLYALYKTLSNDFEAFAEECRKLDGDRREIFNYWAVKRRDLMKATGDDHLLERVCFDRGHLAGRQATGGFSKDSRPGAYCRAALRIQGRRGAHHGPWQRSNRRRENRRKNRRPVQGRQAAERCCTGRKRLPHEQARKSHSS